MLAVEQFIRSRNPGKEFPTTFNPPTCRHVEARYNWLRRHGVINAGAVIHSKHGMVARADYGQITIPREVTGLAEDIQYPGWFICKNPLYRPIGDFLGATNGMTKYADFLFVGLIERDRIGLYIIRPVLKQYQKKLNRWYYKVIESIPRIDLTESSLGQFGK